LPSAAGTPTESSSLLTSSAFISTMEVTSSNHRSDGVGI
jgi:hypothetical protein